MCDTVSIRRLKFKVHPGSNVRFVDEVNLGKFNNHIEPFSLNLTQMSHSILEGYYIEILYRESTYTITDSTVLSNKNREARGSEGCSVKGLRSKVARYTESKGLIELIIFECLQSAVIFKDL